MGEVHHAKFGCTLELQVSVYDDDGGFVGRCDAALLKYGILLEFDGKIKYGRLLRPGDDVRSVVMREKQREQALVELGWLVIRIDWDDLSHPEHLVRRIRRAIEARSGTGFTIRGRHECMPPVRVESD